MPPILTDEEAAIDPYALLGIKTDAAESEIKSTYRKLSLKCHPDRNPDNPNAAQQFHVLSLALGMLMDPSKRAYVNNKLDEDRRKREKYTVMEKKKRGLVDALLAREEEAKRAKVNATQRAAQETEEEAIKQAGRKMREAMQKAAQQDTHVAEPPSALTPVPAPSASATRPAITPAELTLTLQFPRESTMAGHNFLASSATLEPVLTARYGPINHIILKEPPAADPAKAHKKPKRGPRAIVEFKESNWTGCWACWRDHAADAGGATGKTRPLVDGTRVKWATQDGKEPPWVAWAETQRPPSAAAAAADPPASPPPTTRPAPKVSAAFASTFASSFPMPAERREQDARAARTDAARTGAEEYENSTLFKMRQLERERLEAEIRRQEEEEA
ncbi:hypothetical protein NliqN6_6550 [Naganishia liquefaciens]|uniref:J domain-containing protein n=1 Tax=Naganishia liquefaciens TaxID=104408 RepID=A0A8H3TZV5_9TREE|nr:hypothetical protein NliqN6_6550 [Naganishia liquefaciens]